MPLDILDPKITSTKIDKYEINKPGVSPYQLMKD